jgi:hypothetical protein
MISVCNPGQAHLGIAWSCTMLPVPPGLPAPGKVLEAQGDTIAIKHVLQPLVVVMAGANEIDPYKD